MQVAAQSRIVVVFAIVLLLLPTALPSHFGPNCDCKDLGLISGVVDRIVVKTGGVVYSTQQT